MRIAPIAILFALLAPAVAQAQSEDLLGKYALAKIYCIDDEKLVYEIRRGVIEGPNFRCIFANPQPAGAGLEKYDSKCTFAEGVRVGPITLDLADKADHIRLKLADTAAWTTIYPCK
jgi:hypothetical protein